MMENCHVSITRESVASVPRPDRESVGSNPAPVRHYITLSNFIFERVFRKRLFPYCLETITATAAHNKTMMIVPLRCPQ